MIQKNRPVRDATKQVEPEVASFVGQDCIDFHGCRFEVMLSRRSSGRRGVSAPRPAKIVTAQHNDYTGPEKCNNRGLESPINSRKVSLYYPGRFHHALPCRRSHGTRSSMTARIFKPAKNAMQSGTAITKEWRLDFEPQQPRVIEPPMGLASSRGLEQAGPP